MPQVSPHAREIVFKVVYYGPGLGGKTTSLQHVYASTKTEHRGKMVSLATPVDRTLYFDFLPVRVPSSRDMTVRLQLFTVPGQVHYNATRKLVLTGADGVVFVADSQSDRVESNVESLRNLEENLLENGRGLDEMPHVFAYNKRDMDAVCPIEEMERLLNSRGAPSFATVATSGEGVYEALEAITRAVLEDFEQRVPEHRGLAPNALMLPEGGLIEALRRVDDAEMDAAPVTDSAAASGRGAVSDVHEPKENEPVEFGTGLGAEAGTLPGLGIASSNPPATHWRSKPGAFEPPVSTTRETVESEPSQSSRLPVPTFLNGIGMRSSPPSAPPSSAETDTGWPSSPSSRAVEGFAEESANEPPADRSCSLSLLWPDEERATVQQIEQSIVLGETRDSTILCNALLQRCVETLAHQLGRPSLDVAVAVTLLRMPGESYVEFAQLSLCARTKGRRIERAEALKLLLFVTNCHLACTRVTRLQT